LNTSVAVKGNRALFEHAPGGQCCMVTHNPSVLNMSEISADRLVIDAFMRNRIAVNIIDNVSFITKDRSGGLT
jgi:hypothetical protein